MKELAVNAANLIDPELTSTEQRTPQWLSQRVDSGVENVRKQTVDGTYFASGKGGVR